MITVHLSVKTLLLILLNGDILNNDVSNDFRSGILRHLFPNKDNNIPKIIFVAETN